MPRLSTPRMVPTPSLMFFPGIKVPGAENTLTRPARAFGAPHTTCTGGLAAPGSTVQKRRPAHPLHRRAAVAGIHHADAQPVRIGMLLGRNHPRDGERLQLLRLVLDVL